MTLPLFTRPVITLRLNELHIDYCCQGDRTLEAAIEEAGLTTDFITEVQSAYSDFLAKPDKEIPVTGRSDEQLINLILETHHKPERVLLKELDQLMNKILLAHYDHGKETVLMLHRIIKHLIKETDDFTSPKYACPTMKAVYSKLNELADDIFLHIVKENGVLFKRYEGK